MKPKYNKLCKIRTKNGEEFTARLIHLNPQFHRKAECLDVWIICVDYKRTQKHKCG